MLVLMLGATPQLHVHAPVVGEQLCSLTLPLHIVSHDAAFWRQSSAKGSAPCETKADDARGRVRRTPRLRRQRASVLEVQRQLLIGWARRGGHHRWARKRQREVTMCKAYGRRR